MGTGWALAGHVVANALRSLRCLRANSAYRSVINARWRDALLRATHGVPDACCGLRSGRYSGTAIVGTRSPPATPRSPPAIPHAVGAGGQEPCAPIRGILPR